MARLLCVVLVSLLAACGTTDAAENGASAGGAGGAGGSGGTGGATPQPVEASSREVHFASAASDGFQHVGTLQIPAHLKSEKLPAVIFAHGSGPNDRDESLGGQLLTSFGFEIPVFREIGDALQEAGFVVLRFDKRTCGPFNGCAENGYPASQIEITIDTFVQDVEGGLAFLSEQPEVDPERLYFVGHSKGAGFAPRLLTDHPQIRAGVMLAGAHGTVDATLRYQNEKVAEVLGALGYTQAQIDAQLGALPQVVEDLEALRAGTFEGSEIWGQGLAYWNSWLKIGAEAPGLAQALDRPLLALSGDYDWNVPPSETEAWAETFGEGSIHEARILGCVTHAMNCISEPDWKRIGPGDIGSHVAPEVIEAVVNFFSAN